MVAIVGPEHLARDVAGQVVGEADGDRIPVLLGTRQLCYAADLASGEVEYRTAGHPAPEPLVFQAHQVQELPRVLHRGGEEVAGNVPEWPGPAGRDHVRTLLGLACAEPDARMCDAALQVDDGEVRLWPDRAPLVLAALAEQGVRTRVDDRSRPPHAVPLSGNWARGLPHHHVRAGEHVTGGHEKAAACGLPVGAVDLDQAVS